MICPLLASTVGLTSADAICTKEECAWWMVFDTGDPHYNQCAVALFAGATAEAVLLQRKMINRVLDNDSCTDSVGCDGCDEDPDKQ